MKVNYYEFAAFENVFLEDSFVLDLTITPLIFTIDLELVLTQNHSLYHKPLPNEAHCYRKARILFINVKSLIWTNKIQTPNKDITGETDFGNIESFILSDGIYKIDGEIGNIEVVGDAPKLEVY